MNAKQIQKFVSRYIEATESHIVEKSPAHITVKLSPEADRDLTNRSYYWTFVERTGAEAQTMTLTLVFDPEKAPASLTAQAGPRPASPPPAPAPVPDAASPNAPSNPQGDSILGRYFGFAPAAPVVGRLAYDEVTYGSRRLNQLFGVVRNKGRYVQMYEDVKAGKGTPYMFETWLAVNYKVEFCCDMKRDELHSLAISLVSGEIVDDFFERLNAISLTPRLPANTTVLRPSWTIPRAAAALEDFLEREVRSYNHSWAHEAQERLLDELARVDSFYGELLQSIEPENRPAAEEQYEHRKREIDWQYRPRISAFAINVGVFHLGKDALAPK